MIDNRDPILGKAWYNAKSPTPNPTTPLTKKTASAGPSKPFPKIFASAPKKTVASKIRQKFASVPPSIRDVRLAETADIENSNVVTRAANTAQQSASPAQKQTNPNVTHP